MFKLRHAVQVGYNVKPKNDRLNLFLTQYFDRAWNLKWQEFIMVSSWAMLVM